MRLRIIGTVYTFVGAGNKAILVKVNSSRSVGKLGRSCQTLGDRDRSLCDHRLSGGMLVGDVSNSLMYLYGVAFPGVRKGGVYQMSIRPSPETIFVGCQGSGGGPFRRCFFVHGNTSDGSLRGRSLLGCCSSE